MMPKNTYRLPETYIFLMSGIISYQDEKTAKEYSFPANQIVGKDQLTEKFLRELLKI